MDLGNGQGAGIVATQDASQETTAFVRVPQNLVLSKDLVWEYARADADLKAVLEAMGALAKVRKGDMFPLFNMSSWCDCFRCGRIASCCLLSYLHVEFCT